MKRNPIVLSIIVWLTIIIIAAIFACCTKPVLPAPCSHCLLISEKYTPDSTFIQADTLWNDPCVPEKEMVKVRAVVQSWWMVQCYTGIIEHWYYVLVRWEK